MTLSPRIPDLVRAKIVPAPLPQGFVTRPRVVGCLSGDDRFTLVSAMAGFGKTAAVRQWVEALDIPVAWLSLDLLDEEPVSFWSNVLRALGAAVPGIDAEPAMLLWERGADDPVFLASVVTRLNQLDGPLVLVLDGLSEQHGMILAGLTLLVDRGGQMLRVVVTTRSDPGLPLARWRASSRLNEVREDVLRLTDAESLEIAASAHTAIDDPAELLAINRRVDGWPIGFQMALLSRPPGTSPSRPVSPTVGSNRLLASYLAAEVLDAMSDDERDVALTLCVLSHFDPDMCRRLAGPGADDAVRQLLRRGMFLSVVDERVGSMRFHDLFRELMETELSFRDPIGRVELHRRAAMLWRERGDLMSAYHHLAAIGETSTARELLVGPTLALVDSGDLGGLHRLARQLPTPQDITNPNLAVDLAVVALYADGTRAARRWCKRAVALVDDAEGHDEELSARLLALRCTIALLEADLDGALAAIDGRPSSPFGSVDVFEERLPIVAARVMLAARRDTDADHWITQAEAVTGPAIVTEVTVPTLRCWFEWLYGSLPRAMHLIDGALMWLDDHRVDRHHLAFDTLITGAWCRLGVGDITDAARLTERARVDADALGCPWNHLQAGHLRARLALITGEPALALTIIDDLRAAIPFDTCQPFAERFDGIEIEALAATGHLRTATAKIGDLHDGPRSRLLQASLSARNEREVHRLLADRASWPAPDRIQAEVLLACSTTTSTSAKLIELVTECAEHGWVLPLLGLGPRAEALVRDLPLATIHPQLERTLGFLAPPLPTEAVERSGVRLTSRELTLVELLPTHLSNAEIGDQLFLSVNTVKSNLKSLYRKLDASTRTEAVDAARRAGLI